MTVLYNIEQKNRRRTGEQKKNRRTGEQENRRTGEQEKNKNTSTPTLPMAAPTSVTYNIIIIILYVSK